MGKAVLNKLTSNGERIAVVERDISDMKKDLSDLKQDMSEVKQVTKRIESLLGWLKWIGGSIVAIALSLIGNFVYSLFT